MHPILTNDSSVSEALTERACAVAEYESAQVAFGERLAHWKAEKDEALSLGRGGYKSGQDVKSETDEFHGHHLRALRDAAKAVTAALRDRSPVLVDELLARETELLEEIRRTAVADLEPKVAEMEDLASSLLLLRDERQQLLHFEQRESEPKVRLPVLHVVAAALTNSKVIGEVPAKPASGLRTGDAFPEIGGRVPRDRALVP